MLFVKANFTCLKIHVETEDYANTLAKITDREKKSFFFFSRKEMRIAMNSGT